MSGQRTQWQKDKKIKWQTTIYKTLHRKHRCLSFYLFVFLPLCFLSWYLQLLRPLVFCVMFHRSLFVILSMVFLPLCFLSWYLQLLRSLVFCVMFCRSLLLKISEAVNIRTENTMAKRQKTKWQITIYETLHRKLKISEAMFCRSLFVILSMVFLPLCFLSWYLQLLRSLVFCVMFSRSLFVFFS
jgi:hypothetical protein